MDSLKPKNLPTPYPELNDVLDTLVAREHIVASGQRGAFVRAIQPLQYHLGQNGQKHIWIRVGPLSLTGMGRPAGREDFEDTLRFISYVDEEAGKYRAHKWGELCDTCEVNKWNASL